MGCLVDEGIAICGNFAERLAEKPKDFDFEADAKWWEDYPFDWREQIGGTVCNCKRVKVNYQMWYGYDYFHQDSCFLMQKYHNTPNPEMFYSMEYLPSITRWDDAAPATASHFYIKGRSSSSKVKVRLSQRCATNLQLQLGGIS